MKTLRPLAALGAGLALLFLAGCAPALTAGVVVAKDFNPAHIVHDTVCGQHGYVYEYAYGYNPATGKYDYSYKNVYKCIRYDQVPREVPDAWSITIEEQSSGDNPRREIISVTERTYDEARNGYYYDTETGELDAR